MASACIHEQDLGKVLKHLHPNTVSNIDSYKEGSYVMGIQKIRNQKKDTVQQRRTVSHTSPYFLLETS